MFCRKNVSRISNIFFDNEFITVLGIANWFYLAKRMFSKPGVLSVNYS